MNDERPSFWFPVKRYGWGWGLPVRWQGWLVLLAYFALLYMSVRYVRASHDIGGFFALVAGLTVALVAIIIVKGERPPKWRWGKG